MFFFFFFRFVFLGMFGLGFRLFCFFSLIECVCHACRTNVCVQYISVARFCDHRTCILYEHLYITEKSARTLVVLENTQAFPERSVPAD